MNEFDKELDTRLRAVELPTGLLDRLKLTARTESASLDVWLNAVDVSPNLLARCRAIAREEEAAEEEAAPVSVSSKSNLNRAGSPAIIRIQTKRRSLKASRSPARWKELTQFLRATSLLALVCLCYIGSLWAIFDSLPLRAQSLSAHPVLNLENVLYRSTSAEHPENDDQTADGCIQFVIDTSDIVPVKTEASAPPLLADTVLSDLQESLQVTARNRTDNQQLANEAPSATQADPAEPEPVRIEMEDLRGNRKLHDLLVSLRRIEEQPVTNTNLASFEPAASAPIRIFTRTAPGREVQLSIPSLQPDMTHEAFWKTLHPDSEHKQTWPTSFSPEVRDWLARFVSVPSVRDEPEPHWLQTTALPSPMAESKSWFVGVWLRVPLVGLTSMSSKKRSLPEDLSWSLSFDSAQVAAWRLCGTCGLNDRSPEEVGEVNSAEDRTQEPNGSELSQCLFVLVELLVDERFDGHWGGASATWTDATGARKSLVAASNVPASTTTRRDGSSQLRTACLAALTAEELRRSDTAESIRGRLFELQRLAEGVELTRLNRGELARIIGILGAAVDREASNPHNHRPARSG